MYSHLLELQATRNCGTRANMRSEWDYVLWIGSHQEKLSKLPSSLLGLYQVLPNLPIVCLYVSHFDAVRLEGKKKWHCPSTQGALHLTKELKIFTCSKYKIVQT